MKRKKVGFDDDGTEYIPIMIELNEGNRRGQNKNKNTTRCDGRRNDEVDKRHKR